MEVVVTGATGFVGSAMVRRCIEDSRISKVFVLSRKEIATDLSNSSKVQVIIHSDFLNYPASLTDRLNGAQGCLWCIGGKVQDFPDLETARKVSIDYTLAAAEAFANTLAKQLPSPQQRFAFVFCSGRGAEQDEDKTLWLFPSTRKIKGAVEKGLFDIAKAHSSDFDTVIVRPGGIVPDEQHIVYNIASYAIASVMVSDLARVMVDICIEQPEQKVLENEDVVHRAQSS